MNNNIINAAEEIFTRINNARDKAGRSDLEKIFFTAVSKTRNVDEMHEAEKFMHIDYFGENRVQEAESKNASFGEKRIPWRLIGHLQANKARKALEIFDYIDSLDSIELANRLNRIAGEMNKKVKVLIEINTSGEESKSGISRQNFNELVDNVIELENLGLEGFMTVGPLTEDKYAVRRAFAELRELAEHAREITGLELPVLSMGMSSDFELAILEGSTMVRIGSLLFGPRVYK